MTQPSTITFRQSLGLRLLRYVFGCYLLFTILVTTVQLVNEYTHIRRGILSEIIHLEKSFKGGIARSLWDLDVSALDAILDGLLKIDVVTGVKVTNDKGATQATVGNVVTEEMESRVTQQLLEGKVKEIQIALAGHTKTIYEYRFPVGFKVDQGSEVNIIGYCYIYAAQNTVIHTL